MWIELMGNIMMKYEKVREKNILENLKRLKKKLGVNFI